MYHENWLSTVVLKTQVRTHGHKDIVGNGDRMLKATFAGHVKNIISKYSYLSQGRLFYSLTTTIDYPG